MVEGIVGLRANLHVKALTDPGALQNRDVPEVKSGSVDGVPADDICVRATAGLYIFRCRICGDVADNVGRGARAGGGRADNACGAGTIDAYVVKAGRHVRRPGGIEGRAVCRRAAIRVRISAVQQGNRLPTFREIAAADLPSV